MTESMPPTPEEMRQLNRRLNEQVLEQAAADPQWKQRFLDDPEAATDEFADAQRLREVYESGATSAEAPPEAMPTPQEECLQLQRSMGEKVLDKAASDPAWKEQLLDDPEAALREANFPELQQLRQARQRALISQEVEVHGTISDELRCWYWCWGSIRGIYSDFLTDYVSGCLTGSAMR